MATLVVGFYTCLLVFIIMTNMSPVQSTKLVDIDRPIPVITINIVAGYTARLECDLQSSRPDDSAYLVLWYIETEKQPIYSVDLRARPLEQAKHWKNDRLAARAQFDTSTASTAAFMLSNVSEDDDGTYRCRVDFRHTPTRHVRYKLNIVQLPKAPVIYANSIRQPGIVTTMYDEGTKLILICEVTDGGPNLIGGWYRDGKMVEAREEYRMHHGCFYHLELPNLSRNDHRATYTCQVNLDVTPPVPPIMRNITLNIKMKPKDVEIIQPGHFLEAGKVQHLLCKATGANPPAVITWYMNNVQLTNAEILVSDEVNGTISKLSLIPTVEDETRNKVICRAETPTLNAGVSETELRMQVFYPPRTTVNLGRHFTEEIREGKNVVLDCDIRANPPYQRLTWMHNGKIVKEKKDKVFFSNQTLVLKVIDRHGAGNYTCTATNRLGESTSAPYYLQIKYAPVCRRSRPLTVVVSPEQPVTLRCQVEANPDVVSFGWTLSNDRETLRIQRELSIDSGLTSILEYTPRRDTEFGRLKCWARNDIGEQKDPCVFIIVKEGLPPTPSQCAMQILPRGVLEVKCRNGVSKGVPALVKEFEQGDESEADGGGDDDGDEGDVSMSGSSNIYWLHLYNADTNALLRNMSNKVAPHFNLSGIDPNTRVEAVVVTTNRQGRSEPVTLEGAVERAVGSRAANEPESSVTMVVVLAAPGALLIAIIGLATILAIYHRQRKRNNLRQHQPSQHSQSVAQTRDVEDVDTTINYSQSKNNKQPDLIKSKREISDFEYQLASPPDEPLHPSLVVVTSGATNNSHGSRFNEGSTVTYTVQQHSVMEDRDTGRNRDPDRDRDITAHHKPGILRLHSQQHGTDFTVRQQPGDVRDQSNTSSNVYVYR